MGTKRKARHAPNIATDHARCLLMRLLNHNQKGIPIIPAKKYIKVRSPRSGILASRTCFINKINKTVGIPFARLLSSQLPKRKRKGLFSLMLLRISLKFDFIIPGGVLCDGSGTKNRRKINRKIPMVIAP